MSNRTPCRFHQRPGGCRKGDDCNFLHAGPPNGGVSWRNVANSATNAAGSNTDWRSADQPKAPPGVCNEFWNTGKCRRSFDCRYRHVERQEDALTSVNSLPTRLELFNRHSVYTFSPAEANLNPSEVHNHMRKYLVDGYNFRSSNEIYAFVKLLSNAIEENKWTVEDGQLLLTSLATIGHNGLLRIGDILRHPDVNVNAGASVRQLSFQRGYLPLLTYLSSDFVIKSAVNHNVNALYALVYNEFEKFADVLQKSMDAIISSGSFKDCLVPPVSQATKEYQGNLVFSSLAKFFFEYLTRFRRATSTQPTLISLVRDLQRWLDTWITGIMSDPPTFEDVWASTTSPNIRSFMTNRLRDQVAKVIAIVEREEAALARVTRRKKHDPMPLTDTDATNAAILSSLEVAYDGPGDERPNGARNDNDFADINQIRIAPTHEELTCAHMPFLPANIPNAPHHLPAGSMERLLDIQFRLLREELIAPIRMAVQLILQDLRAPPRQQTTYSTLSSKRGGRYNGSLPHNENVIFNLYTNCTFHSFGLHPHRGATVLISIDAPPGSARSPSSAVRSKFWEGKGGKRLMQGGLIALVWSEGRDQSIFLGIVASSLKDLADSAKTSDQRVQLRVSFFDPEAELRILKTMKNQVGSADTHKLLIEAPVMFEAIRPFLDALRVEPTSVPFSAYLIPRSKTLIHVNIEPPKYATVPGFGFDLRCLFRTDPPEVLRLIATNTASIDSCRHELRRPNSRLDASQADAIVDALTREVALIQGPPGTGKTYVGVELLRVLLANKGQPILMIAFTNHALDHMLSSVLEAGITDKILRLGSRSADERISKFNLDTMGMVQDRSRLDGSIKTQYRTLKDVQEAMDKLMGDVRKVTLTGSQMETHLQFHYPDHHASLFDPPPWIGFLRHDLSQSSGWEFVGSEMMDNSLFSFWEHGRDLNFLKARPGVVTSDPNQRVTNNRFDILRSEAQDNDQSDDVEASEDEGAKTELGGVPSLSNEQSPAATWMQNWPFPSGNRMSTDASVALDSLPSEPKEKASPPTSMSLELHDDSFAFFGLKECLEVPHTDRPLDQLLSSEVDLWRLSDVERERLAGCWRDDAQLHNEKVQLEEFRNLRKKYEEARTRYSELEDQSHLRLMKGVEIVGCTTNGAAKLSSLLKGFSPKVMLVEEAGQVLEAHVLGSLVPSIEHLILIGDPLQLRPNLANFGLSVDSRRGATLYRFDVSLMERLSTSGLSMSRLDIQRRMRPSIANLVRSSLYPAVQDHDLTKRYPNVRGMASDVFFLSHGHRETGGGEDSVSKHNMFEVKMIVDLVLYLLRQGRYSGPGDIVVLCAYLGQLIRVRDALAGKVVTVIDDRDQEKLAVHEEEREDSSDFSDVTNVPVSQKVLLRTIDNYQGEEATITILSLVRNGGSVEDEQEHASPVLRPSIGFLKSRNRTNVALSRAKHGLYILGNASNLATQSSMWRSVLEILESHDAVGNGFPISCAKHPEEYHSISEPGMLPQYSPDGGCLRPCSEQLRCGHTCPYKCHPDDENHNSIFCSQSCLRLCPQGHPCDKQCSQPCGKCYHPVLNISLSCGHHRASVPCHELYDESTIDCHEFVVKPQPNCEHPCLTKCGEDPVSHTCDEICGGIMPCCGRRCSSTCHDCQTMNKSGANKGSQVPRTRHKSHPCRRTLFCGHPCREPCSEDHECTARCSESCLKSCEHTSCKKPCHVVCAPCAQPCSWECIHQGKCPVPCGSICARLPCDVRCPKMLSCGHQCPSLCGEPCSICIYCAPEERKQDIVDLILQTTLQELDPGNTSDDLIITLTCKHTFTVASLDGICEMDSYYCRSDGGQWAGLTIPPPGFRPQPVCPTCRFPITISRYGRIFKRAGLDLAERTVASDMSQSLQNVSAALRDFDKVAAQQEIIQGVINGGTESLELTPEAASKLGNAQNSLLQNHKSRPIAAEHFIFTAGKRKGNAHPVSPAVAKSWRNAIRPLSRAYTLAMEIKSKRPAHTVAFENAFSTLYHQETDEAAKDPAHAPRRPTEHAMRMAKLKVGQPPPRADKRFSVEALWLSLKIRFLMGELAEIRLVAMQEDANSSTSERFVWASFIRFIYLSCIRDVKIAIDIAKDSQSHRQIVISHLMELKAQFDKHRFDVGMRKQQRLLENERHALLLETQDKHQAVKRSVDEIVQDYLMARNEAEWLSAHFTAPASAVLNQWEALERSIDKGKFYQVVSLEEITNIVQAFRFSHTGHWYTCENGHAFVITECGGAMEVSSCPECGSIIGGTGHSLHTSNVRLQQFEDIARTRGAEESPWAWARAE